mgnify:CR=1 FL=1
MKKKKVMGTDEAKEMPHSFSSSPESDGISWRDQLAGSTGGI